MPVGRYYYFGKQRLAARCRFFKKKRPRGKGTLYIILFGLIIIFLLSLSTFGTSLVSQTANYKAIVGDGLKMDYEVFIHHSLPGMNGNVIFEKKEEQSSVGIQPVFNFGLQSTPHLFLDSELAGFKAAGAAGGAHHPSSVSDCGLNDDTDVADNLPKAELQDDNVSFLLDKRGRVAKEKPFTIKDNKPLVLIYHSHASESFIPVSGQAFSDDPGLTVISLGASLAELLENKYGIPVMHNKEVFDVPRQSAYEKARPRIEELLKQNPQVEVVLDLHRDGVSRRVTTANMAGQNLARILFVIDTHHEGWHSNLRFALFLEKAMEERFPGLSRNIRKHASAYNQDLHPRSLIVEIGGHENNREETTRAVSCLAEVLAAAFQ